MTAGPVLLLYNEPRAAGNESGRHDVESDAGVLEEVAAVSAALDRLGIAYRTVGVRALHEVGRALHNNGAASCIFNLVESLDGAAEGACLVPAACEAMGKPWTGNGTACQIVALDKWQSKCALKAAGVPVPNGFIVTPTDPRIPAEACNGPVIVKPLRTDASEGIAVDSVVMQPDPAKLLELAAAIHRDFNQPALIEQYVNGREFNVALLERQGQLLVLPLAEIDFTAFQEGQPRIVDYRAKWIADSFEFTHTPRRIPADLDEPTAQRIRRAARDAWHCLGCRDYARVDMRLDAAGRPFVIEVNPNPDISPDAGYAAALQAGGIAYSAFVQILLENAGIAMPPVRPLEDAVEKAGLQVRGSRAGDRHAILDLLAATAVFRPDELDIAREVLDEALTAGADGHYQSYTALLDGQLAGWLCFGPTPCTVGTFDIYWLAVDPAQQGRRVGSALLEHAEWQIQARNGRLLVVETSSRDDYAPARAFYERHGYRLVSTIPDFYEPSDDRLVYIK